MQLTTYAEARDWLMDHTDGLRKAPTRLHTAALGEGGTPDYSGPFWAILTGGAFDSYQVEETRTCQRDHRYGDPCAWCGGNMTYVVPRTLYRHPLAAALERLRHAPASSHDWPTPYELCVMLLRADFNLDVAAAAIDHPILGPDHRLTVEAAFTLAVRKLAGRWATGPVPKRPSEAQSIADAAA